MGRGKNMKMKGNTSWRKAVERVIKGPMEHYTIWNRMVNTTSLICMKKKIFMRIWKDRKWKRTRNPSHPWNPPKLSGPPLGQVVRQNVGGKETPQTGLTETSLAVAPTPERNRRWWTPQRWGQCNYITNLGKTWGSRPCIHSNGGHDNGSGTVSRSRQKWRKMHLEKNSHLTGRPENNN